MRSSLTRARTKQLLVAGVIALAVLIIGGYAYYTSRNLVNGPEIIISSPIDGSSFASSSVEIVGDALRIKEITMNGRSITIDENGNFKEYLVLFHGYNVVVFVGKDQFGRTIEKKLQFVRTN